MNKRINHISQVCSAERVVCTDGKLAGLKLIRISNGILNIDLTENKALDILRVYYRGENTSFISKNGATNNIDGFLRAFAGGALYTCGYDAIGAIEGHELHGNLHNIPAEIKQITCDENGITVVGEIADTALFGQNLVLTRRIFVPLGKAEIHLVDTLKNNSYRTEEYCTLYHINSGYPLLDENTQIIFDAESTQARTAWAGEHIAQIHEFSAPVDNQEEMCYFHKLKKPEVKVLNASSGKSLTISYTKDTLPCLVEWKSQASGDYALGIEPCTSFLDEGNFHYSKLGSGEEITFGITLKYEGQ